MERTINLVLFVVLLIAIAATLPRACATQAANDQAAIEIHKDSIGDTYISPADQVYIDFASDDFKKANQHANEVLRRAYSEK